MRRSQTAATEDTGITRIGLSATAAPLETLASESRRKVMQAILPAGRNGS